MVRLISVAFLLLLITGCANVEVTKLAEDEFLIEQIRFDPPISYESRALTKKADQLCPIGFSYLLRQAHSEHEFATDHQQCAVGQDCQFTLQWRIRCGNIPREPFSLFGKS